MSNKKKGNDPKENISVELRFPKYVGYADCMLRTSVSVRIGSKNPETSEVAVSISDANGLTVPYETVVEVPFESAVEVEAEGIFSPLFLANCNDLARVDVTVSVSKEGKPFFTQTATVSALPYDWWEGLDGNAERLAAFVRPRIADCSHILEDAGKRLKKWNADAEFFGYTGADKNAVRQIFAAVYAALKARNIEKSGEPDLGAPVAAVQPESMLKSKKATALELAVFAAACLEAVHLHPVLAVGKRGVAVGVWLYDSCFLDSVTDDAEIVGKYISEGINNLSFIDAEDLFGAKNIGFTPSEAHFAQKLQAGYYEYFTDVRRCRMGGISPLPVRGKGLNGWELVPEKETSPESAPAPLPEFKKLSLEGKQSRNRQWERRLLDLTTKNPLLNFFGKNSLHICCADADGLYARLAEAGELRLKASPQNAELFGADRTAAPMKELIALEARKGILRAFTDPKELSETAVRLMRKNREADEETGARILYLAFGFLRYVCKEDGQPKYAPLVLAPVAIKRARGNDDFGVSLSEGEYFVNSTLLEYLKQEFNIDVRGLGESVSSLKIAEILAMVRAETASMKGWDVVGDVYLAAFSFQRYLMWNDLHSRFSSLKSNAVVSALLNGTSVRRALPDCPEEDEGDPADALAPLPADSSQYGAIALSRTGASFVLHGPPGTGKSQTITNIIANALRDGKRVLFVAEKKAALDVVKKRLDGIGIGDFCLELHSNKTDKADVLRRLEQTLALSRAGAAEGFAEKAEELKRLRASLVAPMRALHRKRRLGISVYQAILLYLENKNAPDVADIESSFYDSLSERRLADCKRMILTAAAAAKECGGVSNSPFENVNTSEYTGALRDHIFCASEVLIAEIKHLRGFLGLLLEFYRQRMSVVTRKKLLALRTVAEKLVSGAYDKYYAGADESAFYAFFNANKRLDERLGYYNKHFKSLADFGKDLPAVRAYTERGGDWRTDRAAAKAVKLLGRCAKHEIAEEDVPKFLQTVVDIYDAMARISAHPLARNFTDRSGGIVFRKRAEFLADLTELHALCATVFLDFNPDSFNGMCIRATSGYTRPVLEGYLKAADAFFAAQESFLAVTKADRTKIKEEDVLDYFSAKAAALIDNIDMLPNWCMYRRTAEELGRSGLNFITEALESGRLSGENILAGFEKNVYRNFLEIAIPADEDLSRLTVGTLEDTIEKFRLGWEDFTRLTREYIRSELVSRLPGEDGEGPLGVELSAFARLSKSNLRGTGLRALFREIPELMKRIGPCMLMSPITVAQYLEPEADLFDLVIFDEASQMTTAEAIGSIARAKSAIVVGDPKQLPPTAFFHSAYVDEENLENEDLESVLDDCLALGMPERRLMWHYRSKHESLIAFSNGMYYDNRLCTFPSPDALESKVKLIRVDGVYDRGFTKRNRKEAEALVREVVRRLSDPVLARSSMGVVTFSSAQRDDVDRLLTKEILARKLESAAYDREEPLFVKNLENVQGDERDVILFSVCYGPDSAGRVSLNFGPLNQAGGWRRLNVAVSRAREEMLVFSTMTGGMIDLRKTTSKGVIGLKAFLDFAEKGRTTLAVRPDTVKTGAGIGKFIAAELAGYGYECRCDVGASDFKIDVAVLDPKNKKKFLLAIVSDASEKFSLKDRTILQVQTLKRGNWNVIRVNCVNYFNNPKREIKRIKDLLDKLTGADKKSGAFPVKYKRPYKAVKAEGAETASYLTSGENDAAIIARLKEIVAAEEPISRAFLRKRLMASFGIPKGGAKTEIRLNALIDGCAFRRDRVLGTDYFYKNDRAIRLGTFRVESGTPIRKTEEDFTPYELLSFIKGVLEDRVALYMDELIVLVSNVFGVLRPSERFVSFVRDCVSYGEEKGILVRSVSDRISLA